MLSCAKNTEEEASLRQEGEFLSLDSLKRSDNNDEDDDGTGAEDNNCYRDGAGAGDGDGGGDRNNGAGGGSAECPGFLSQSAITEAFVAMAKAKPSLSTESRKTEAGEK